MKELSTKYDPKQIEEVIYAAWENDGLFKADPNSKKEPYTIVIPPPNVTGILHMGHALNNTIQDILIRWKRMQGFEALWMPGIDHAGIATQNVVEKKLAKENIKRSDLGREKFLEEVWKWKEEHGLAIIRQLKRLGCSCDWDRTRFTMDEGLSNSVKEVFVKLYEDNLIYKGDYIINWCPRCETALSDEEAEHKDINGNFYYIKYPVKGKVSLDKQNEDYVVVATTRPETMLGDVAVAVNPKDKRYTFLKDKTLILPIVERELKIIFDETVDIEVGTGALKVTPAHDPVDFELGTKHNLNNINVMYSNGTINELGGKYKGMDRFECRKEIVKDLKEKGYLIKSEPHNHAVGHCYRCHTIVEPRLSKQWFVKMKPLSLAAIKASIDGKIIFHPDRWTKVYLNWMENIRDWCISRQIWWGHRIPVWYCKDCLEYDNVRDVEISKSGNKGIMVGENIKRCSFCSGENIEQDPDVLDTWFSSWLWPFSTLGWPKETEELSKFYPTDALVTAPEIIFFWVARMIMSGLKFIKQVPFKDVYIHGTVRDETGTKMSKSLGNVIDPIDVINEVGSDALRFSIICITAQGQDVFLSKDKFELGRNFANKLWNASRYVFMNIPEKIKDLDIDMNALTLSDKWILSSMNQTIEEVNKNLSVFRFNDAANVLYDFVWHKYCDWYLEISKLTENRENTNKILVCVLENILKLLHPIMPFVTEEIWSKLPITKNKWIMTSKWPEIDNKYSDEKASRDMDKLIEIIKAIRNIRSFWNISLSQSVNVHLDVTSSEDAKMLSDNTRFFEKLAKCTIKEMRGDIERPNKSAIALAGRIKIFVPIGDAIDVDKEKARIEKKIGELEKYLMGIDKKLGNKNFVDNAPDSVVTKEKDKQEGFKAQISNLKENLSALE